MLALAPSQSEYMAHNECSVLPEGHCQIHDGGGSSWAPSVRALVPDAEDRAAPAGCCPEVLFNTNVVSGHPIPATPVFVPPPASLPVAAGDFLRVACKKL